MRKSKESRSKISASLSEKSSNIEVHFLRMEKNRKLGCGKDYFHIQIKQYTDPYLKTFKVQLKTYIHLKSNSQQCLAFSLILHKILPYIDHYNEHTKKLAINS